MSAADDARTESTESTQPQFRPLQWLLSRLQRPRARTAVDLEDPVGSAIDDAEVLMAFAAQSAHVMKRENLQSLTAAIADLNAKRRLSEEPTAEELTRFWVAYDELGNSMAPLSALSIRASMRLNAKRFPLSLLTATGMNAMFAIGVFIVCILLQGFWGAGRELLDKAEALDDQKTNLQLRMQTNEGILTRRESQINDLSQRLCPPDGLCPEDGFGFDLPSEPRSKTTPAPKPQLGKDEEAKLRAERQLAMAELREKEIVKRELFNELLTQTERSRAVEAVIKSWYDQTNVWCESRLLKILCPIKQRQGTESPRLTKAKLDLKMLSEEVEKKQIRLEERQRDPALARPVPTSDRNPQARPLASYESGDSEGQRMERDLEQKKQERWQMEQEVDYLEAESLRAMLLNVRLTLANIANYLIPMLMGLLGALAFILRSLTIQLREHTYVHMSASLSVVRMCLGAVAGVFGTLLAPVGDGALKGLPPLIIPFVFGYGIEILFSIMDRVVGSFTQADGQKTGDKAHV